MAHIIPSDITRLAMAGAHSPELETLRVLKRRLPNDYTVFHGVHWTREYRSGARFGEIDFVVLNRSGDVLFIEQKNGALEETGGGLVKSYDDRGRNVVDQVTRSMEQVLAKFQWRHGRDARLTRDYLIYLPDYRVANVNAAGLAADRVVDAGSKGKLAERIDALLGPGVDDDGRHFERVHDFFRQTFQVVADVATFSTTHDKHFIRQVGPAAEILANLEMDPFRLRFEGAAGSGKSLLAHQFFTRQSQQGSRVLLVCFNRPLAERLRDSVADAPAGCINNFHGFCAAFLESRGLALTFPERPDAAFWNDLQEQVCGQNIPDDWQFDTLIVDEGQDFEREWLEILRLFVPGNADILWLEDSEQNLYAKERVELDGFVTYRCRDNYRTPDSIARFIRAALPIEFEPRNDLPGLGVGVDAYDDPAGQVRIVDRIVQDRVKQGFAHEDIVILTCGGLEKSVFFKTRSVAGIPLRRPTREYRDGRQVLTPGRIGYDSIYRYKGQQSPSVILVDVGMNADRLEPAQRALYCGMTRATVRLDIVAARDNPGNRQLFDAADS